VRVKIGGGIAGHNGLRSISECIGNEYCRVRLGVGHPGIKDLVHGYVLSDFPKVDWPWVKAMVEIVAENVSLLAMDVASFQNKVHLSMELRGFDLEFLARRHKPYRP
jgi:PTH1 family peptidyl-tRNA hydrolase